MFLNSEHIGKVIMMDINETSKGMQNRHPWELSRTKCVLEAMRPYLSAMRKTDEGGAKKYLNVGAGDLYFDDALMRKWKRDVLYAVDIGYSDKDKEDSKENNKVRKFNMLEEIPENDFDYALMMDSLEYMEDEAAYIRQLSDKLKSGAYIFFTVTAFQKLYSAHDIHVKALRRYDRKSFAEILSKLPQVEKVEEHYFYFSLLCVRAIQVGLHLPIDPKQKITTGWRFKEDSLITKLVVGTLNLDFKIGQFLSRHGICLPGLSLLVVCRKK